MSRTRAGASITKGILGGSILAIGACEGWLDLDAPVGRDLARWRKAGRPATFTLTARAFRGLGQLIAAGGRWSDRQLIDRDGLKRVTTRIPGLTPNTTWSPNQPAAAGGWWTNAKGICAELARDLLQPLVAAVRELPEAPVQTAIRTPSVRGG